MQLCRGPYHSYLLHMCRSEEQRLEISRALIDFQMESNEAKQEWANTK
jgi:hypothetical protein